MPMKMGKPNTSNQLKSAMPSGSIPRAGAKTPGRVGQIATNNKIFSGVKGGGSKPNSGGMKRGKRMY